MGSNPPLHVHAFNCADPTGSVRVTNTTSHFPKLPPHYTKKWCHFTPVTRLSRLTAFPPCACLKMAARRGSTRQHAGLGPALSHQGRPGGRRRSGRAPRPGAERGFSGRQEGNGDAIPSAEPAGEPRGAACQLCYRTAATSAAVTARHRAAARL